MLETQKKKEEEEEKKKKKKKKKEEEEEEGKTTTATATAVIRRVTFQAMDGVTYLSLVLASLLLSTVTVMLTLARLLMTFIIVTAI